MSYRIPSVTAGKCITTIKLLGKGMCRFSTNKCFTFVLKCPYHSRPLDSLPSFACFICLF